MTYREKLIESLTKAGFERAYNEDMYYKDLDDEEVTIRVMFDDYVNCYAEVYMSCEGKTIGDLNFTTNCLYAAELKKEPKNSERYAEEQCCKVPRPYDRRLDTG